MFRCPRPIAFSIASFASRWYGRSFGLLFGVDFSFSSADWSIG
jgi:prolipoprotein diacylglyceryltransferase